MTERRKRIGVILAGGSGSRFSKSTLKQFTRLAGKPIIEHTIGVFEKSGFIDEIIVVSRTDTIQRIWEIAASAEWKKLSKVVNGGDDRLSSTLSAIRAMCNDSDNDVVLFHDAVRPLVSHEILERCIKALESFDAVDVVIPSSDTLVTVNENGNISAIPDRRTMRRGQTPQGFRLGTIREAYARLEKLGHRAFTCDCSVVRATFPDLPISTVEGSEINLKITNFTDLFIAEKLIQSSTLHDDSDCFDLAKLKGKNIIVIGGSSGIGRAIYELGCLHGATVHVASRSANGVDVVNIKSIEQYLAGVHSSVRKIDAVINTAAILIKKPIQQMTAQEISTVVNTNLVGAINVAIASRSYLTESHGCLVNFTSSSYTRGRAFYAAYSSTKCAVVNLSQALSEEWAPVGIRVFCINPERTATPMRLTNFGIEDPSTLLTSDDVAQKTLQTILSSYTGLIVDVRQKM